MRSEYWFALAMLVCPVLTFAQARNDAPETVAGIPVNYDEANVGDYVLPNALTLNDGKPVRDAKTWWKRRRPEAFATFESQQYGRAPGRPVDESFDVFDAGTPALNGKAIRKQVRIDLSKDASRLSIQLLITRYDLAESVFSPCWSDHGPSSLYRRRQRGLAVP